MSKTSGGHAYGGLTFGGALALLFIALKLLGHIDWSWWWVLAPVWGPIAEGLGICAFCLLMALLQWALGIGQWRTNR